MDPVAIAVAWLLIAAFACLMVSWWNLHRRARALAKAQAQYARRSRLLELDEQRFAEQRTATSRALHPSSPGMCRSLAECARMCHRAEQAEAVNHRAPVIAEMRAIVENLRRTPTFSGVHRLADSLDHRIDALASLPSRSDS